MFLYSKDLIGFYTFEQRCYIESQFHNKIDQSNAEFVITQFDDLSSFFENMSDPLKNKGNHLIEILRFGRYIYLHDRRIDLYKKVYNDISRYPIRNTKDFTFKAFKVMLSVKLAKLEKVLVTNYKPIIDVKETPYKKALIDIKESLAEKDREIKFLQEQNEKLIIELRKAQQNINTLASKASDVTEGSVQFMATKYILNSDVKKVVIIDKSNTGMYKELCQKGACNAIFHNDSQHTEIIDREGYYFHKIKTGRDHEDVAMIFFVKELDTFIKKKLEIVIYSKDHIFSVLELFVGKHKITVINPDTVQVSQTEDTLKSKIEDFLIDKYHIINGIKTTNALSNFIRNNNIDLTMTGIIVDILRSNKSDNKVVNGYYEKDHIRDIIEAIFPAED